MKMTTRSIEVPLHHLAAVQMLAAVKDTRWYLCGVAFDPAGYMVATDGCYLMAARAPGFAGIAGWKDKNAIIVPNDLIVQAVKSVKPSRRSSTMATITFTPQGEEAPTVTIAVAGAVFGGVAIDGYFPDWRRIIPTEYSPVAADEQMFDPELLMQCRDALRVFYDRPKSPVYVTQPASRAAVVRLEDADNNHEITMLMPTRVVKTNDEIATEAAAKVAAFMRMA